MQEQKQYDIVQVQSGNIRPYVRLTHNQQSLVPVTVMPKVSAFLSVNSKGLIVTANDPSEWCTVDWIDLIWADC